MAVKLKAVDFEILRGVEANGRIALELARRPVRVATLLDEAGFMEGHFLVHNKTVFLEDRVHDWNWTAGKFRYYTRIAQRADVLVVYAEEMVELPARFDPMTGHPQKGGASCPVEEQQRTEGEDRERNQDAG